VTLFEAVGLLAAILLGAIGVGLEAARRFRSFYSGGDERA
jgi:hypothetical protein